MATNIRVPPAPVASVTGWLGYKRGACTTCPPLGETQLWAGRDVSSEFHLRRASLDWWMRVAAHLGVAADLWQMLRRGRDSCEHARALWADP